VVQALLGEPLTIYGRGDQTRSFCYVSDLVEALELLMQSPSELAGPVNLGNPEEHTILELAEAIRVLVGSRSPIEFKELPNDDPVRRRPDIGLAAAELDWQPKVALEDGLKRTIEYFDALLSSQPAARDARARRAG
jgi:UDP-glucuronate decarboxylase